MPGRVEHGVVDVDSTFDGLAVNLDATAQRSEEKRQVDEMMQAEGQKHALGEAIDERAKHPGGIDECRGGL